MLKLGLGRSRIAQCRVVSLTFLAELEYGLACLLQHLFLGTLEHEHGRVCQTCIDFDRLKLTLETTFIYFSNFSRHLQQNKCTHFG